MKAIILLIIFIFVNSFAEISRKASPRDISPELGISGTRYLLTFDGAKRYYETGKGRVPSSNWHVYLIPVDENSNSSAFDVKVAKYDKESYQAISRLSSHYELAGQGNGSKFKPCSLSCDSYYGEIRLLKYEEIHEWIPGAVNYRVAKIQEKNTRGKYQDKPEVARIKKLVKKVEFPGRVRGMFWVGKTSYYQNDDIFLVVVIDYSEKEEQYAVHSFRKENPNVLLYPSRPMTWDEWKVAYKDHPDFQIFYETLIAHLKVEVAPLPVSSNVDARIKHLGDLIDRYLSFASKSDKDTSYFYSKELLFAGTDIFTEAEAENNLDKLWWVNSPEAAKAIDPETNISKYMEVLEVSDDKSGSVSIYGFPKWNEEDKSTPRIRYVIPIDDYKYNSNPPLFKSMPDIRLYFGEYARKFHKEYISEEESPPALSPGKFSSFLDYARYKLYTKVADNAIYNEGNKLSSYKMGADNPPEEAYYYAHGKDGKMRLINDKSPRAFERNFNPETARYLLVRCELRYTKEANWVATIASGSFLIGKTINKTRTIAIPIDLELSGGKGNIPHPLPELVRTEFSAEDVAAYYLTDEYNALKDILSRNINNPENLKNEYVPIYDTNGVEIVGEKSEFEVNITLNLNKNQKLVQQYLGALIAGEGGSVSGERFEILKIDNYLGMSAKNSLFVFNFDVVVEIDETIEEVDNEGNITTRVERKYISGGNVKYSQNVTPTFQEKLKSKKGYWHQPSPISVILSDAATSIAAAIKDPALAMRKNGITNIHFVPIEEGWKPKDGVEYYIGNAYDGNRKFNSRDSGHIKYGYLYDEYGAMAGHPLQIHDETISHEGLLMQYQESAVYLKLRFPVIPIDSFGVASIVGYIYYGDTGFGAKTSSSYVKREYFRKNDVIYKNPKTDFFNAKEGDILLPEVEKNGYLYILYDRKTKMRVKIVDGYTDKDDEEDEGEDAKRYYKFLLKQRKNLVRPGWTSGAHGSDMVEMWAGSGYDHLGKGVLDIYDCVGSLAPYCTTKVKVSPDGIASNEITSWITPYYRSARVSESADKRGKENITGLNHILIYDKSEEMIDLAGTYNKRTKEYYTDQKDINERDKDIEGGEAMWKIALKIVVAEVFNISAKVLHKVAEKYKQLQPVEASAILLQDKVSKNIAYKIAKEAYRTYCVWRTTMDTAAEIRDRAKDAAAAWQGLKEAFGQVGEYYKDFDWKSVKMTNITKVLPNRRIYNFKGKLYNFENSTDRFMDAIDRMAFHSDTTLRGNYGPLNPLINWSSSKLAMGLQNTFEASDKIQDLIGVDYSFGYDADYAERFGNEFEGKGRVDERTAYLDNYTKNKRRQKGMLDSLTGDAENIKSYSRAAYLSNITLLAKSAVHEVSMDVLNDEISALAVTLSTIESDSKSWVQYVNYQEEWVLRFQKNFKVTDYYDTTKGIKNATSKGKSAMKGFMRALDYPNNRVFSSGADNALYRLQDWSKNPDFPGNKNAAD